MEAGLDIAILVVLGYFFLRGIFRGLVKEVLGILGLFVAFWVASVYWPIGAEHLKNVFDSDGQRGVTSFLAIFMVVYFFITLIAVFIDKIVKMTISPVVSSLLGALVGAFKGALICGIILLGAQTFIKSDSDFFTQSVIWPYLRPISEQARAWVPATLNAMLNANPANSISAKLPPHLMNNTKPAKPVAVINPQNVDWKTIQNILTTNPDAVSQAWRDKLRNITGSEALSDDDIKRFISDHPALFSQPAGNGQANIQNQPPSSAAPAWPQPAQE